VEARQLVWDLRSGTLEQGGLPNVIRELGDRIFDGGSTGFTMTVTGTPRRCAPAVDQHLMRIAQEALGNAARYAGAESVHVGLEYRDDAVRLEVSDNGRGLNGSERDGNSAGHYGLRIMQERADQIGARFRVDTGVGRGTRIEVLVPNP